MWLTTSTESLIVELFKGVSTCFEWSYIDRFYLTREIGSKYYALLAVFKLETDYPSETGYLLDNYRQTYNTS